MQSYACRCKMQNAGTGCRGGEVVSHSASRFGWSQLARAVEPPPPPPTTTLQRWLADGQHRIQPAESVGRAQRSTTGLC